MSDSDVTMKENGTEEKRGDDATSKPPPSAVNTATPPSAPSPIAEPSTPAQSTKSPEAEKFKEEGNKLFAEKHFAKATDCYTKGLVHHLPSPPSL